MTADPVLTTCCIVSLGVALVAGSPSAHSAGRGWITTPPITNSHVQACAALTSGRRRHGSDSTPPMNPVAIPNSSLRQLPGGQRSTTATTTDGSP